MHAYSCNGESLSTLKILEQIKRIFCWVCFNNITTFSQTLYEHLTHFDIVLSYLPDAGPTDHPKKAQL